MSQLCSTRNFSIHETFLHAISHAQPNDGGLWYRKKLPKLSNKDINTFVKAIKAVINTGDDNTIRLIIKNIFLDLWSKFEIGLDQVEIQKILIKLDNFSSPLIVPIELVDEVRGFYLINETTGPTNAFKDLALQMLTAMISQVLEKKNKLALKNAKDGKKGEKISFVVSQTSTSGDTGPAGGSGIEGENFIINTIGFPANEVTYVQAGQMMLLGNNVMALPMKEAFTAIQEVMKNGNSSKYKQDINKIIKTNLKDILAKYSLNLEVGAGSFNSVNVGRIDGQSIYQIVGYLIAKAMGITNRDNVNIAVPSGNFGHSFSILQAKQILKNRISKIIVSTNENDAIYKLIKDGYYKIADKEICCPSVSMIIRYGSNIERLFAMAFGDELTAKYMKKFYNGEEIVLSRAEHKKILDLGLVAYKIDIEDELMTIKNLWLRFDRLICPHTANAYCAAELYQKDFPEDDKKVLINQTSSPWKFLASIAAAISIEQKSDMKKAYYDFLKLEKSREGIKELLNIIKDSYEEYNKKFDESMIPENLRELFNSDLKMEQIIPASEFQNKTLEFLQSYSPKFLGQIKNLLKEKA